MREYGLRGLVPRPPMPTMPTLILSFAPQTREAAAAVTAPRKNLRVLGSVTTKLLIAVIISGGSPRSAPPERRASHGRAARWSAGSGNRSRIVRAPFPSRGVHDAWRQRRGFELARLRGRAG